MQKSQVRDLILVGEAARILGKSPAMVRVYERTGKLEALKIAGMRFFHRKDVERLLSEHETKKLPASTQSTEG